jgi:hypothetical protein
MSETPGSLSMLVSLCDTIVDLLNDAQVTEPPDPTPSEKAFVMDFTAVRRFVAIRDPSLIPGGEDPDMLGGDDAPPAPTLPAPLVAVVPVADPEDLLGGGSTPVFFGHYAVDVTIYMRVGKGDAAERVCAMLMDLRQEIREFFKGLKLTVEGFKTGRALLEAVEEAYAFDSDWLKDEGVFASPQRLKFVMTA